MQNPEFILAPDGTQYPIRWDWDNAEYVVGVYRAPNKRALLETIRLDVPGVQFKGNHNGTAAH